MLLNLCHINESENRVKLAKEYPKKYTQMKQYETEISLLIFYRSVKEQFLRIKSNHFKF
jgi:hypothetical protein